MGNSRIFLQIECALILGFAGGKAAADEYDLVIYGGSPAGLMAGVAASREGARVAVIEPTAWIGGMVAGGLSKTDIGRTETIGGLALEFFERCSRKYEGEEKWFCEPHVYHEVFDEMMRESALKVVVGQRIVSVARKGEGITGITTTDGRDWRARMFVDASYEGDLMARADVSYIVGRESRETYDESLGGFYPNKIRGFSLEIMTQGCSCVGEKGPHYVHGAPARIGALDAAGKPLVGINRSTAAPGARDGLTQAYNFRLCVTQEKGNLVPWPRPGRYDVERYELLLRLIEAYPGIRFGRIVHLGRLTNGKFDLNAQGLFSTDYVGGNTGYPDGDYATRDFIWQDHVDYVQGLFWFLAHDRRVPAELREETMSWGLCRDEFTDNAHWPYHLYVREARRMIGEYVMVQRDLQRAITKPDSVGMGSFIIDSHIVQRLVDVDGTVIDEGAFDGAARPYQIPYRSLTPKNSECGNLLVPLCLSASHVAYGSIRMEPVYMAMGQVCGLAAVQALKAGVAVQEIDTASLREKLLAQNQVLALDSLQKIVWDDQLPGIVMDQEMAKFSGSWSSSGFGNPINGGARHDQNASKGKSSARFVIDVPAAGEYEVRLAYAAAPNRANNVPVVVAHASGEVKTAVNQRLNPPIGDHFISLGIFRFTTEKPASVTIGNEETNGYVSVDAVQLLPVR